MWKIVKLGDMLEVQNGYAFNSKQFDADGDMPLIRIRDLKNATNTETCYTGEYDDKYLVQSGDLLIGMDGEFRCYEWHGVTALLNQRVCRLQNFHADLDQGYLLYAINSELKKIEDVTGFTTVKHLSSNTIKQIELTIPPLAEQQRIVAKLDATFAEIDIAISKERLKEIENEKLKAKILSNFLYHKDRDQFKLNEICLIKNGGTPNTKIESYWDGDITWLTPKDMGKLDGKFVNDSERKISNHGINNSSAKLIPSESIILSCRAPIGHVFINKIEMSFNQGCKGLITNDKVNVEYLYYFLLSSKKLLNDLGTGTTFKEISSKVLGSIEIALPPLHKQEEAIAKLDAAFLEIEHIEQCIERRKQNYAALKAAILSRELQSPKAA